MLRDAGHDVGTVFEQGLSGAVDRAVIDVCKAEGRCLVTLDLDFGNPLLFRHTDYHGVALFRLSARPSEDDFIECARKLSDALAVATIVGKLWIIQRDRVREYRPDD